MKLISYAVSIVKSSMRCKSRLCALQPALKYIGHTMRSAIGSRALHIPANEDPGISDYTEISTPTLPAGGCGMSGLRCNVGASVRR